MMRNPLANCGGPTGKPPAALPPVRSDPLLSPENIRVWQDIVDMCKRGGWSRINVASKQRMAAILAVDAALSLFERERDKVNFFVGRQIGEALRSNGGDLPAKQVKRGSEPTSENATTSLPGATPGDCRGCDRCTLPPNDGHQRPAESGPLNGLVGNSVVRDEPC